MTTSQNYWANNYKNIMVADLESKIENMQYELSTSNKTREELVLSFINVLLSEFDRIGNNIEGFLSVDRRFELETMLVDFSRTQYNICVYELMYKWN